ncbi:MAG: hypothetical protein WBD45_18180 [Terriglobales bacterium]
MTQCDQSLWFEWYWNIVDKRFLEYKVEQALDQLDMLRKPELSEPSPESKAA